MSDKKGVEEFETVVSFFFVLFVTLCILLFFLMCFGAVLGILIYSMSRWEQEFNGPTRKRRRYPYQYLRKDYGKNTMLSGMISQPFERENESYFDIIGDTSILISQIGLEEFECSGSCYCGDNNEGTEGAGEYSNRMMYLVGVDSSANAYNLAQKHFTERCTKYSDECRIINSEVHDCSRVMRNGGKNDQEGKRRKYICSGNCLNRVSVFSEEARILHHNFECENLAIEGVVVVKEEEFLHSSVNNAIDERFRETASILFLKDSLSEFCRGNSLIEFSGGQKGLSEKSHVCEGIHTTNEVNQDGRYYAPKNVWCHQIEMFI